MNPEILNLGVLFYSTSYKAINRGIIVNLARTEHNVGKALVMHAVGHFLRLQTECHLLMLDNTALEQVAVVNKEIAGIELNAGLIGIQLHATAAGRMLQITAQRNASVGRFAAGEIQAMIVAA